MEIHNENNAPPIKAKRSYRKYSFVLSPGIRVPDDTSYKDHKATSTANDFTPVFQCLLVNQGAKMYDFFEHRKKQYIFIAVFCPLQFQPREYNLKRPRRSVILRPAVNVRRVSPQAS
jgi:hypothetical protein